MEILITLGLALTLFVLVGLALSLKVIFGRKTPLKEHACDVMCRHGRGHTCTCAPDGSCSDFPNGHPTEIKY